MIKPLKPGDRVRYIGAERLAAPGREITGTIEALLPGHRGRPRPEIDPSDDWAAFEAPYPEGWCARVKLDAQPKGWKYPHSSRFFPAVADLELL